MSGGSSVSFSCGYCESHETSAPRSIIPIFISKTIEASFSLPLSAYSIATFLIGVVDMKANSTPPRTLYSLGISISFESARLEMPR